MSVYVCLVPLYQGLLHDLVPAQWLAPVVCIYVCRFGASLVCHMTIVNPWPVNAKVSNDGITGAMYSAMLAALESQNGARKHQMGWAHNA